jgi:3-dehydroquinate synthetase
MGKCDLLTADRIIHAALGWGQLPQVKVKSWEIVNAMQGDKKKRKGVVHFVLPRGIGKVEIVGGIPDDLVVDAVDAIRGLSRNA